MVGRGTRTWSAAAVLVAAGMVLTGCAGVDEGPAAAPVATLEPPPATVPTGRPPAPEPTRSAPTTSPTTSPAPSPTPSAPPTPSPAPPPALATPDPWAPGAGELRPEIKTAAAGYLEQAGTWVDGAGDVAALEGRLLAAGSPPQAAAAAAAALGAPGAQQAALRVVYPQWGGLTDDAASVMAVVEQTLLGPDGSTTTRSVTVDVRLAPAPSGGWQVTAVEPDPLTTPPGPPSALAEQVLATPSLRLPGTAVADIRAGRVDDVVLGALLSLSQTYVLDVSVLNDGHPQNVFATDRQSNHTRGRAVDVWAVDGRYVVDLATPRELLAEVMVAASTVGATEVGGPFDLNGARPGYFTDASHSDHLHLGFSLGRPPAVP